MRAESRGNSERTGSECRGGPCPTIKPLDTETILESVRKTGRAVTTEDAQKVGGLGGAIAELW